AAGCRHAHEYAVAAGDTDVATLGVEGDVRAGIGVEIAELVEIDGDVEAADLEQPHLAVGVHQSGIDVSAGDVDAPGLGRHVDGGADGDDPAVLEQHGRILQDAVGDGVHGTADQCDRPLLPRR